MAKKVQRAGKLKIARRDWARFAASNHGQGPHKDRSKYTRKRKHRRSSDDQ